MSTVKEAAVMLSGKGYSVIPVNRKKVPLMKWKYQQGEGSRSTPEQIEKLFTDNPSAQLAIITGWNNLGILDLDVKVKDPDGNDVMDPDKRALAEKIVADVRDKTLVAESPSGGFHIYFRFDEEIPYQSFSMGEVRTDKKHYTLVPPSDGYKYLTKNAIAEGWSIDVIRGLLQEHGIMLEEKAVGEPVWKKFASGDLVPTNERHDWMVSRGGSYRRQGDDVESIYQKLLVDRDTRLEMPETFPDSECRSIAESMNQYVAGKPLTLQPKESKWASLIPFEEIILPEFPLEALPDPFRSYAAAVAEEVQAPIDLAAVYMLPMIGMLTQGRFLVNGRYPTNIYSNVVLESGSGKSPVYRTITRPLEDYGQELVERYAVEVDEYNHSRGVKVERLKFLKKEKSHGKHETGPKGRPQVNIDDEVHNLIEELDKLPQRYHAQLLVDDVTAEGLVQKMSQQYERLGLFSSEGDLFAIMAGRYGSEPNFRVYLESHDGVPMKIDRKTGKPIILKNPLMSIGISLQPTVLSEIGKTSGFWDKGLVQRFLWSMPVSVLGYTKAEGKADTIPAQLENDYRNVVRKFAEECIRPRYEQTEINPITLGYSPEAAALKQSYEEENILKIRVGGDLENHHSWGGKFKGHFNRLAGLVHIAKELQSVNSGNVPPITVEAVENACLLWDYFTAHSLAVANELQADPGVNDARYLVKRLSVVKGGVVTKRDIMRLAQRFKTVDRLEPALRTLEKHNYIKEVSQTNGQNGRPSEIYFLHPEYPKQHDNNDKSIPSVISVMQKRCISEIKTNKSEDSVYNLL